MGTASSTKIAQEISSGGKRITWGYTTNNTSTTAEVITGLNFVYSFEIQPYKSSGVAATESTVNETFPLSKGTVTIITPSGVDMYWCAIGE